MIALLASFIIMAITLVFAGGAWHVTHPLLGWPALALGAGMLGIIYATIIGIQLQIPETK